MAPTGRAGYWGPPTATLDWCEDNYVVSYYIAEFWNTVSNLLMILAPLYGAVYGGLHAIRETRYLVAFLGLAVVGIGSWWFHMTLLYQMQLLDELPMIYSCCILVYCLCETSKSKNTNNYPLGIFLFLYSVMVTAVYLAWKEPIFHQVMYALLVSSLILRSVYLAHWIYPQVQPLVYSAMGIFFVGFILWNVDNLFCSSWRKVRAEVPVLGVLTQFHAWWHILTGFGSYMHILFSLYVRVLHLKYKPRMKFVAGVWPVVVVEAKGS
uniref:alkaline ceramidase 3 n=1 Tax=Myxine glutinosa TaxID=7769 RepID=UPI00358E40CF